jgi:hypothetical protein
MIGKTLVVLELSALHHFNSCYGTGMSSATEIFLEIKNIAQCTGHVQFFWIYNLFHGEEDKEFASN